MPNWEYVWAELTRRGKRTWTTVALSTLAISVFLGVSLVSTSLRTAFRAPLEDVGANLTVQRSGDVPKEMAGPVLPCSLAPIQAGETEAIARLAGVRSVSRSLLFWNFEPQKFSIVAGFNPDDPAGFALLRKVLVKGRFLNREDGDQALLEASWAAERKLAPGDRIVLQGRSLEVVGLVEASRLSQITTAQVYLPLRTAGALAAAAPGVTGTHAFSERDSNLLFVRTDRDRVPEVRKAIISHLGDKATVASPESFREVIGGLSTATDRFAWIASLLTLVIAALFVARASAANVYERRAEIGVMRSVGWTGGTITRQLVAETLAQALASLPLGLAVGAAILLALPLIHIAIPIPWDMSPKPHFIPGGADQAFRNVPLAASLSLEMIGESLLVAVLVAVTGSLAGVKTALALNPSEALRHE